MKYFIWVGYMMVVILWRTLFCQECSDAKATRNVRYEYTDENSDSITAEYWKRKSDSLITASNK